MPKSDILTQRAPVLLAWETQKKQIREQFFKKSCILV